MLYTHDKRSFYAIVGVAVASSFLSMIAILLVQKLLYIPQNIVFSIPQSIWQQLQRVLIRIQWYLVQ